MHLGARTARTAGLLYLIGSVTGVFGILYGPTLRVPGDAAATARNILASAALFRLSIVSALLDQIIFILVVLALYQLQNSERESPRDSSGDEPLFLCTEWNGEGAPPSFI